MNRTIYLDTTFTASKNNIEKAIGILRNAKKISKVKRKHKNLHAKYKRIRTACGSVSMVQTSKISRHAKSFCIGSLLFRAINALIVEDWDTLLYMIFHFIKEAYYTNEKMIWKFAVIAMLHYPNRSKEDILEFLKICIGSHDDQDAERKLKEILTLPSTNDSEDKYTTVQMMIEEGLSIFDEKLFAKKSREKNKEDTPIKEEEEDAEKMQIEEKELDSSS